MVPMPELFRHRSYLRGPTHVARVMVHAMRLVEVTGQAEHGARYLRHPESKAMLPFAQGLFDTVDGVIATGPAHYEQLKAVATRMS